MEEVMCLEGERQYFERYLWFYGESAIIFMYICEEGIDILFLLKLRKEGLTMMLKGAKMARLGSLLGSAQLGSAGSARLGSSIALLFRCVKLYYIISSVKIRSRVNRCLISDFFLFCGKGACC